MENIQLTFPSEKKNAKVTLDEIMSTNSGSSVQDIKDAEELLSEMSKLSRKKNSLGSTNESNIDDTDKKEKIIVNQIDLTKKFVKFSHKKAQNQFKKFKKIKKSSNGSHILEKIDKDFSVEEHKTKSKSSKENRRQTSKPKTSLKKFISRADTPSKAFNKFHKKKVKKMSRDKKTKNQSEYFTDIDIIPKNPKSTKKRNKISKKFGSYLNNSKRRLKIPRTSHQEYSKNNDSSMKKSKHTNSERRINFQGFVRNKISRANSNFLGNKNNLSRSTKKKKLVGQVNKSLQSSNVKRKVYNKTQTSTQKLKKNKEKIANLRSLMESIGSISLNQKCRADRDSRCKF